MLLAAAVDAGADLDEVIEILGGMDLDGWALRADEVVRGGVAATAVVLLLADSDSAIVRTWGNVRTLLEDAKLPDRVKARALATFSRMTEVSARLSRRPVDLVHFSEVAALDAIIDVVSTCAAFDLLGIESMTSGPVAQGVGMVRGEHGLHPVPAPEVLALLEGAVTYGTGEPVELCTPTGAALLAEWTDAWGPMPPLTVRRVGYGAGARELSRPNVLRLVIGEREEPVAPQGDALLLAATAAAAPGDGDLAGLRRAGALDAWVVPLAGGRGRVTCVAPPEHAAGLRAALLALPGVEEVHSCAVGRWAPGPAPAADPLGAPHRPDPLPPIPPDPRSA
jgi:hypothetical protein